MGEIIPAFYGAGLHVWRRFMSLLVCGFAGRCGTGVSPVDGTQRRQIMGGTPMPLANPPEAGKPTGETPVPRQKPGTGNSEMRLLRTPWQKLPCAAMWAFVGWVTLHRSFSL